MLARASFLCWRLTAVMLAATLSVGSSSCLATDCLDSDISCNPGLAAARAGAAASAAATKLFSKYLFVTSAGDTTFRSLRIDQTNGALTAISSLTPFGSGLDTALHPTLPVVYTTSNGATDGIQAYSFDSGTGVLSDFGTVTTGNFNTHRVAVMPDGSALYFNSVQAGSTRIFRVPLNGTGALQTPVLVNSSQPANSQFMAIESHGKGLYGTSSGAGGINMFQIQGDGTLAAQGSLTILGSFEPSWTHSSPDGSALHGVGGGNRILSYSINSTSGVLTELTNTFIAAATTTNSIAVDSGGAFVYIVDDTAPVIRTFTVNANKSLNSVATASVALTTSFLGLNCMSRDGRFLFVTRQAAGGEIHTYAVNGDGTLTFQSSLVIGNNLRSCVTSRDFE